MSPVEKSSPRAEFMGCAFDRTTMSEAASRVIRWCTNETTPKTVVTINASHLVMMKQDQKLKHACAQGDLVIPDGVPVIWGSRLSKTPLKERIAGIDLMTRLLLEAEQNQLRIFLLGATPHVLERLCARLRLRYPQLHIGGTQHGYFRPEDEAQVIERIRASKSHILFVGLPSPQKEIWCEKKRDLLGVPVLMGVGGSFDVLSGDIKRAPRSWQNLGLEWSWRLLQEPRKMWKRYLTTNTAFLYYLFCGTLRERF